jgi:hypothetical protein
MPWVAGEGLNVSAVFVMSGVMSLCSPVDTDRACVASPLYVPGLLQR